MTDEKEMKFKAKLVEYQEIQHLRDFWSRGMATREQIFIPLGAVIVSFFWTFYLTSPNNSTRIYFPIIGWVLFFAIMSYWRYLSDHVDQQIVGMYPRMLELEKDLGMEVQGSYYFGNLNRESKNYLAKELGNVTDTVVNNWDYRDLKDHIHKQKLTEEPHDYLLRVWKKFKKNSVTRRGHAFEEKLITLIIVIWFLIDVWLIFRAHFRVGYLFVCIGILLIVLSSWKEILKL